jgi:hypothetical protein
VSTLQAEFEALMPEAATHRYRTFGHGPRWQLAGKHTPPDAEPLFTADQMRAMFDAATERAAKLAADLANDAATKYAGGYPVDFEQEVAAPIRATGGEG